MSDETPLSMRPKTVPTSGMTTDLALIYGNAQLVTTLLLSQSLRARGISTQWDEGKREGSIHDIMENVVDPIIRVSRCVVAIVTAQSVLSEFFLSELTLSDDHSKPIVVWQPSKARFDDPAELAAVSMPDYIRIAYEIGPLFLPELGLRPPTEEQKAESARRKALEVKRRMTSKNIVATLTQGEDEIGAVVDFLQELVAELRLMQQRQMPVTGPNARVAIAGKCTVTADSAEEPAEDRKVIARANLLGNRGYVLQSKGHLDKAWDLHLEAISLHRRSASRLGEAIDLGNFGVIQADRGDFESALSYYRQSLEIHRSLRNREGEADQLNNVAVAERMMGNLDNALAMHERALAVYQDLGSARSVASQCINMGNVYQAMGRLDDAIEQQRRALAAYRTLEMPDGQAKSLANLGMIAEEQGQMREALNYFREALGLAREASSAHDETNLLICVGRALTALGELQQAKASFTAALALARQFQFYSLEGAANLLLREPTEARTADE
jgi:tetratricopeptide (TPR) repeat protein